MSEFYGSFHSLPGETVVKIVERDDEEQGTILYRPDVCGTQKSLEEVKEWLRANGFIEGHTKKVDYFAVVENDDNDICTIAGTSPENYILVSIAPVENRAEIEEADPYWENPKPEEVKSGLGLYDDYTQEYLDLKFKMVEQANDALKGSRTKLYNSIKKVKNLRLNKSKNTITFTKDGHEFEIQWNSMNTNPDAATFDFIAIRTGTHLRHGQRYQRAGFDTFTQYVNDLVDAYIELLEITAGEKEEGVE